MTRLADDFVQRIKQQIQVIEEEEKTSIDTAADWVADTIASGGLVHLFGCGHSHLLVEDFFYRAGGMVPINAIFETSLMLHEGAVKSSKIERMQGYAEHILANYSVTAGEVMIVISNSGINSLPIEMAQAAKAKGLKVIALCSSSYFEDPSRHPSGQQLHDLADLVINNHLPHGDALVQIPGTSMKMASGSTIIGSIILNMVMTGAAQKLVELGIKPPVYVSGNIPGGAEQNEEYIKQYRQRIKHL
ncbi:sugar isomerase domain-containing protein [Gorillibacterium timonense]|uniref:sugar isomerase domain-containing protein n=1 Tax=Gorillibacterium timonense TaxID=1689269 RepID=UPI00071CA84C|nr:SIS domain-containing protein [Gorillibacterium timonense]